MTAQGGNPGWAQAVVSYLTTNMVRDHDGLWCDYAMTALQQGCLALAALGQAELHDWGAKPLSKPALPEILPRWDDICVVMLVLAHQNSQIDYRDAEGRGAAPKSGAFQGLSFFVGSADGYAKFNANNPPVEPPVPVRPLALPPSNIAATEGLGQAFVDAATLRVLSALGLIADGTWTKAAELIFWRIQPGEWGMDVSTDPRFTRAVEHACRTMPTDLRAECAALVRVTDSEVSADMARYEAAQAATLAKFGPKAKSGPVINAAASRNSLARRKTGEMQWMFYKRWRLAGGWLSGDDLHRRLEVFSDPLANQMQRAVIARLYPGSDVTRVRM